MRTVLIVGAGATRAEAETKQLSKGRLPPLDTDFFELCRFHKVTENLEALRQYVNREYQIDITQSPHPRMEEIFGLVYGDTRMTPPPPGARDAFVALCRVYQRVILDTTNRLEPSNRGPVARLVRFLVKTGTCTIITFNQDVVAEKALVRVNRRHPIWYPDTGYTIPFSTYTSPTGGGGDLFDLANGSPSLVSVLKMHGSLNWYTTTPSLRQIPSTMPKTKIIKCTRSRSIPPDLTYLRRGKWGRKRWYTWPVIVPPVFEKGAFLTATLSPIWQSARKAIETAEQIVVFGYSFPQSDQQGRMFFRRARANNKVLKRVVVINTVPNAAIVANEIFGPATLVWSDEIRPLVEGDV